MEESKRKKEDSWSRSKESKRKKKIPDQDRKKAKKKKIPDQRSKENKKKKFPTKDQNKAKEKEIPNQRLEEDKEVNRKVFGPDNIWTKYGNVMSKKGKKGNRDLRHMKRSPSWLPTKPLCVDDFFAPH